MRLLYAGHTYLVDENQKKLAAIARAEGIDLAVVVPHIWREPVLETIYPHLDPEASYRIFPTRIALPGDEMRYFYLSMDLHMRRFHPDIIVVENGAGALAYTQFLLSKRRFAPQAKAVFFTWWNIPYRPRQPFRAIEHFNLQNSDGAIAGSRSAEFILRENGYSGPLLVLPQLGVDATLFAPGDGDKLLKELGLGDFVIGYAGRLVSEKGLRVLMRSLEGFGRDFDLLLVGNGPLEPELRVWGAALPEGRRLRVHPSVPHAQIPALMQTMDVFVLPSLTTPVWKEQFGHVLIEAMACGVPVVGSDSAEIPEVIGGAGRVVPEDDPDGLRVALRELAANPDERTALGLQGRARVLAQFTHERISACTVDFLFNLLDS